MATAPDDVAPLLTPAGEPDLAMHQGTVIEWDAASGHNKIGVLGTTFSDLTMLNISDAVYIMPGDVVGVLRFRTTYFILGRIVRPGSPRYASTVVAFDGDGGTETNFGVNTLSQTATLRKISRTFQIPPWVDEVLVSATAFASIHNQSAGLDYGRIRVVFDYWGGTLVGGPQFAQVDTGWYGSIGGGAQQLIGGHPSTITAAVEVWADLGNWQVDSTNIVNLNAQVFYRQARAE